MTEIETDLTYTFPSEDGRKSAVDAWLGAADDLIECSECGHLHFDPEQKKYVSCPLADEGCTCAMGEGS